VAEERRKRKGRGAGREAGAAPANGSAPAPVASHRPTPRERMEAGYAKAEVRNQAAREALEPLAEGQRPPVVTVSAILSALVAVSIIVTFAAGVKVNGSTPKLGSVLPPALILGVLAWGMWRARYWAVICFQVVLVFLIFTSVYGLMVIATSVGEFAVSTGLLVVSGVLFWMMVKAMARIQMLERMPPQ
jgi:hypothetical protein